MKIPEEIRSKKAGFTPKISITFFFILAPFITSASPAMAHAFGIRYDLPLPLWLYLSGAGAAVALSFLAMALVLKDTSTVGHKFQYDLFKQPSLRWLGSPAIQVIAKTASILIFLLILTTAFFGNTDPFKNFAPTFVWVGWWVGMAFISSLIGNLWDLVNPWKILYSLACKLTKKSFRRAPYPYWLGQWPAVVFLMIFVWMELISEQAEQPRTLGILICLYSVLTWAGMRYYGQKIWLKKGDVFSAVFSLLARFAPFHGSDNQLLLRPPSVGLLTQRSLHISEVCFVLLLLTSVTFDGILETPSWAAILNWIAESQFLRPTLLTLQQAGTDLIILIKTLALVILPLLFVLIFYGTGVAIAHASGGSVSIQDVVGYFVLSVVPIAIAYHLSHYLSYLLIAGQNLVPLISDPYGTGWNLFGTAHYTIDIGIVNAKMIWYVAVTAIVSGHVMAVYIAHVMALRIFKDRRQALYSQFPMLILMVGYTMISLWILSQPIIT